MIASNLILASDWVCICETSLMDILKGLRTPLGHMVKVKGWSSKPRSTSPPSNASYTVTVSNRWS